MNYYLPVIQAIIITLGNFVAWIPLLPICFLGGIKWDKEPSMPQQNCDEAPKMVIQGDVLKWFSWFQTPDQRLPGDLTIKEVRDIYNKYGQNVCSYYWMASRNVLMGMACALGKNVSGMSILDLPPGQFGWKKLPEEGVWRYTKKIGPIVFLTGYEIYNLSTYYRAAPFITLKWAKDFNQG